MKKMMKTLVFVAAAAMGLTACQNDFEEQIEAKDSVVVTFVADSADSRTSVDTTGDVPVFAWAETGETFAVLEQTDALATASDFTYTYEDGKAEITATFDNNAGQAEYNYVTVYPLAGYVSAESINNATLCIPADQTMYSATSYDHNADLMVSKVVTTTEQPTEVKPLQFTRLAAVAKMSFRGFADAAEKVESVTFTTAEGVNIAGTFSTDLTNPVEFTTVEGVNSVTVTSPDGVSEVYFTLLPTTLEAGATYSVMVMTDKKIYKKEATIPEGKSLEFAAGMVTRFGVDLTTATVSDKWVLVRDVNDLNSGDVVTFVAKNYNYVLGVNYYTTTTGVANYAYASQTEVVKDGDLLYHNVSAENATSIDHIMQKLTLVKSGDKFNFYNGVDYVSDPFVGYLMASKSNRYMHIQTYPNADTAFSIAIDKDGVATIEATESDRTYKILQYYSSSSNKRFCCVSSSSSSYVIHIYKLAGANETVPAANASIVTPGAEEYAVIENEEVTTPTKLNDVVFNYVGDWEVSVEDDATWLEIVYNEENNCLNYTVEANTQDKRIANVTIKTTLGERVATQTFQLLQKGAPKVVSIEEFNGMEMDVNVTYKLTGRVTKVDSTTTSSYEITDGTNSTLIKFLYTEGGEKVYGNDAIGLEVGDVVTVYTIVCEEDVDAGGNTNYHSTYLSHYNLTATQTAEADYTEDGTATVSVARTDEQETTLTATTESEAVKSINNNDGTFSIVFNANDGAPRVADVTFTDGLAEVVVSVIQKADESKGNTWKLVTDASELKEGDKVIIAARDYALAMSTSLKDETSTATPRLAQAVTKIGDYLDASGDKLNNVEQLVLMNGTDGQFAFYDVDREAFLVSSTTSTSSYYLVHQNYRDMATNFGITISTDANGVVNTTIENTTDGAKYEGNILGYYHSNGYFYSAPTTKQAVAIYKLAGVEEPQIPVIPAYAETADLVIEKSGIETTEAADVKFYEVGNWAISASAKVKDSEDVAEWLTLAYADGKLTYAAEANAGVMREAVVTLNATQEIAGVEKTIVIGSFNVLQKGLPKEISIAEFNQKEVDKEIEYIITGRLKTMPSGTSTSVSNTFVIEDEDGSNTAKITYFYDNDTADGQYVMNTVDLKVGDVVTVRTIVAKTKGTGGAKLSDVEYKSIYMGHYNLTATTPEQVAYTGGTATITDIKVNIYGTISTLYPNTTIKGESEFAGFSYADGSDSATVTFDENAGDTREVEATFKSGMANLSVTVSQQNNPNVGWFLVTDASELQVGDKLIIAGKSVDGTKDYAISTATSSNSRPTIEVSVDNNRLVDVEGVQQYTLEAGTVDGTWAFKGDSDNKYFYVSSGYLRVTTTKDANGSWSVAIADDGKATLTSQTTNSKNTMMLNDAYTKTITVYASTETGKGAIYIYKYKN